MRGSLAAASATVVAGIGASSRNTARVPPPIGAAKYGERGLQTVAVHMPRYEADTDLDTVNEAMFENNITEPVAVDSLHKLKDAFQNEQGWVPVYYLFDAEGKLKTRAAGEFGISVLQTALDKMFPAAEAATA